MAHGLRPRARILGMAATGMEPELMGIGPIFATRKLMDRLGLSIEDFDATELNEAFASKAVAALRTRSSGRRRLRQCERRGNRFGSSAGNIRGTARDDARPPARKQRRKAGSCNAVRGGRDRRCACARADLNAASGSVNAARSEPAHNQVAACTSLVKKPLRRSAIMESASAMMRSIRSRHVGMSWISPWI